MSKVKQSFKQIFSDVSGQELGLCSESHSQWSASGSLQSLKAHWRCQLLRMPQVIMVYLDVLWDIFTTNSWPKTAEKTKFVKNWDFHVCFTFAILFEDPVFCLSNVFLSRMYFICYMTFFHKCIPPVKHGGQFLTRQAGQERQSQPEKRDLVEI